MCNSIAIGETAPTTAPTNEPIVQVILDDPLTGQSRCYLNLTDGKSYPRGEPLPDAIEQRHWINERSINLQCETRPPAEGFVIYDLVLTPIDKSIDSAIDYASIRDQLQPIEPQPFDLIKVTGSLPRTFAFRTPQYVLGIIEVNARPDHGSGLCVRYKLLHPPPLPPILRDVRIHQLIAIAAKIQANKQLLQTIDPSQTDTIKSVQSAIDMLQQQTAILTKEPDAEIAANRIELLVSQHLIDSFAGQLPENDPFMDDTKRRIAWYQNRLDVLEHTRTSSTDRKRGLVALQDAEAKRRWDELVKRYDDSHPVVDPSLKEPTKSEKLLRMQKSYLEEQSTHASQGKHSIEQLLALQQSRGLSTLVDSDALRTELENYANRMKFIESGKKAAAQREQGPPSHLPAFKPTTFPAVSNFRL